MKWIAFLAIVLQRATRQQITHHPWIHRRARLTPTRQNPYIHTRRIPLHAAAPRPFRRLRDTQLAHLQPDTINITRARGHIRRHRRHAPRAAGVPVSHRAATVLGGAPHPLVGGVVAGGGREQLGADVGVELGAGVGVEVRLAAVDLARCVQGAGEVVFLEDGRRVGCEGGGVSGGGGGARDGGGPGGVVVGQERGLGGGEGGAGEEGGWGCGWGGGGEGGDEDEGEDE